MRENQHDRVIECGAVRGEVCHSYVSDVSPGAGQGRNLTSRCCPTPPPPT